jgi:hypothetical protein
MALGIGAIWDEMPFETQVIPGKVSWLKPAP